MTELRTIAALYVDPRGPYPSMPGVECWDEERDARLYDGPHPVVAHPPCGPWSKLRHMCTKQDASCGAYATKSVQRFGGVLEHPEHSRLWDYMQLPPPGGLSDGYEGFTVAVNQVSWGHACAKPTWLYCVGLPRATVHAGILRGGEPTHCVCTGPGQLKRLPVAHAGMKRRTPPAFAAWLVSLARSSQL